MVQFRGFEFDVAGRELRRGEQLVHLEPQAFDLLAYLIAHCDRVVSKIELMDEVWGHQFLSEANLTTRVKEIRNALGDDGRNQHTIRNVRGRGYRFVADLDHADVPTRRTISSASELLGREDEAAAIVKALADSLLVTVVGAGGVGKTATAIDVSKTLASTYRDGVHVIEFAALTHDEHALPSISRALGIVFDTDHPESAIGSIAHLDALVVLDNCEHLCDVVSDVVRRIANVPGRRIHLLATSQIRLGVSGEVVVSLGPLRGEAAMELFRIRARAVAPDWDPSTVESKRVMDLVSAIDRLPLTVEMAAARLGAMTFDDLEHSISDGTPMVHMTHRTPARRHRSLASLVNWSVDLLTAPERETFMKFAVFAHEVGVADITAVLGSAQTGQLKFELAALADHSLLVADTQRSETRYSMLTTMRTVATEWLNASSAADALRERHAEHFADVLCEIDDQLRTRHELDARQRLDDIVDEVRQAFRWAQQHRPALASHISGSLFHATNSSLWFEPANWGEELLAANSPLERSQLLGAKLTAAAAAAHRGQLATAREYAHAVAIEGEGRQRATAIEILADVALYEGDLAVAIGHAESLLVIGEELHDAHAMAFAATDIALARTYLNDSTGALAALDAFVLDDMAPSDQAWIWHARGEALSAAADPDASVAFHEAIRLGMSVGNHFVISVAHTALAAEYTRVGDVERAFTTFATSLRDSLRHGNLTHAVTACRNLIRLLATVGDDHGATLLAGAMSHEQLRVSYGAEASSVSDVLIDVEARVGTSQFTTWFAHGRTLDLPQAVRNAADRADHHKAVAL